MADRTAFFSLCLFVAIALLTSEALGGARVTVTPRLSLSEAYSDNYRLSSGQGQKDWITVLTPGLDIAVDDKTRGLSLSYNPSSNLFNTNTEDDYWAHQAQLTGWNELSGATRLTVYGTLLRTEEPQTDATQDEELIRQLDLQTDLTRRDTRQAYWQNTLGASLSHQISPRQDMSVSYTFAMLTNDDPGVQDNTRHSPAVTYSHRFDPQNRASAGLNYTRGDFSGASDSFDQYRPNLSYTRVFSRDVDGHLNYTHTVQDYQGRTPDYQIYHPSAGLTWRLAEDVPLSLNLGYFFQDRDSGDDEGGPTVDGDLGYGWQTRRSSFRINGSSGYDQSFFGAENLGLNTFYQLMAQGTHELSRFTSASINASYREIDYVNDIDGRRDEVLSAGMDFKFSFVKVRWLHCGLSYRYRDVASTAKDKGYEENRVTFSVSAAPNWVLP